MCYYKKIIIIGRFYKIWKLKNLLIIDAGFSHFNCIKIPKNIFLITRKKRGSFFFCYFKKELKDFNKKIRFIRKTNFLYRKRI